MQYLDKPARPKIKVLFGLLFLIVKSDGEKNRDTVTLSSNTLLLCIEVSTAFVVHFL